MQKSNSLKRLVQVQLLLFFITIQAQQNCDFSFRTCLGGQSGTDTIYVPLSVIAMSSTVKACEGDDVGEGVWDTSAPPSIVFVIDNSGSMTNSPGNDVMGARFVVTRDLLDTIYSSVPNAEVGVVVFREKLYLDNSNNSIFVPLPGRGNQSYLPLIRLNSMIGAQTGIQAIGSILATDTLRSGRRTYVDLIYRPAFTTTGYTNINSAFDAAREALKSAKNPKDRQFVIFLSDGLPNPANDTSMQGGRNGYDFVNGTNMPTTFTVYLSEAESRTPDTLIKMTDNIRNNGYSATNSKSNIWTISSNYDDLMSLLLENILKPILTVTSGNARSVVVNRMISQTKTDSGFVFQERFPLNKDTTSFHVEISLRKTNTVTGEINDTLEKRDFVVVRRNGQQSPDLYLSCWDKPQLGLYHNGKQVYAVSEAMADLEIRFVSGDQVFDAVSVDVTHTSGIVKDIETIALEKSDSVWAKHFQREINENPDPGDLRLQHLGQDSIVVIFRNPELPLDSIRLALPFVSNKAILLTGASYFDINADGYIDSIAITGSVDQLSVDDPDILREFIKLPQFRKFVVESISNHISYLSLKVQEKREGDPITNLTRDDVIEIENGVITGDVNIVAAHIYPDDKVAPVILSAQALINTDGMDSLRVTFSEVIAENVSRNPYKFRKANSIYDVTVDPTGEIWQNIYTVLIRSVQDNMTIDPSDSAWINVTAEIHDMNGNTQRNPNNRRVLVSAEQIPYSLTVRAQNNPFIPHKNTIPDAVKQAYIKNNVTLPDDGLLIVVSPDRVIKNNVKLTGTLSVYDVVKNPIIINEPMVFDGTRQRLFLVWNGKNSNGRDVATGTYLAIAKLKDDQGFNATQILRLGVKR